MLVHLYFHWPCSSLIYYYRYSQLPNLISKSNSTLIWPRKSKLSNTNSLKFHLLLLLLLLSRFSRVRLCATPQTAAHQAPLSLGFSRQEHWTGFKFHLLHLNYIYTWSHICLFIRDLEKVFPSIQAQTVFRNRNSPQVSTFSPIKLNPSKLAPTFRPHLDPPYDFYQIYW